MCLLGQLCTDSRTILDEGGQRDSQDCVMQARVHSVFQVFAQFFVRSLDVHAYGPDTRNSKRRRAAIAIATTAAAVKPAPRGERTAVETRAIYGRVRRIRQEKLGLSQISRYVRNPGPICNTIKQRGEIRIVRDREKKCKTAYRK